MQKIQRALGVFLLIAGVMVVGYAQIRHYFYNRTFRVRAEELTGFERVMQESVSAPKPVAIRVGDDLIDTEIEEQEIVNGVWGLSKEQASYLVQSSRPTHRGNIIIYGHNTRKVFGNLLKVKRDDSITLTLSDGVIRRYQIYFIKEVPVSDLQYLQPTKEEVLTLYTCSGFMDQNRFIVRAKPV